MQDSVHQAPRAAIDFETFANSPPLLHSWDGGKTWNTGGFDRRHFEALRAFFDRELADRRRIIETGCGNSTICFLLMQPDKVVTVDYTEDVIQRVRAYCAKNGIETDRHEFQHGSSHIVLPKMAAVSQHQFDFALIDGCHGWPAVFVDFCYCNMLVRKGGFIMFDDVQLHSVKELARCLLEEKDFGLFLDLGKALVLQKFSDDSRLRGWEHQPYIARLSADYQKWRDPNALYAD